MIKEGFSKFFWGFLFIMFDFRVQGFDIAPDVIGFILFAIGFAALAEHSPYFAKVKAYNVAMIIVSVLSFYERPAPSQGPGIHVDSLGMVVSLVSLVLTLVVVYHLFMGIQDLASKQQRFDIREEAAQKWSYFLVYQIAIMFMFILIFVPPLFIVGIIGFLLAGIILMLVLMRFMKKCGEKLQGEG
ncbi:hypothetical protein DUZ99_16750 [Xylanibacillus composti]|uniref:Uncharacterized protein n=1 Tax=Xylanibacillus composti TaxID=1572762 RepID=A0A8J4H6M5_9BACL|nr:hypothetical protein [Xylanibacillus composti]MDT9726627.1 hypothetical protein [Xylanibacillus composti]GIQ70811.1 hypothetical protein XYCOK13_36350 [Xylanibacillus composti]